MTGLNLRRGSFHSYPHPLVSAFAIPPSRFPDRAQRSRLFFDAPSVAATWWVAIFLRYPGQHDRTPTRHGTKYKKSLTSFQNLTARISWRHLRAGPRKKKGKDKADPAIAQLAEGSGGEHLRTVNSLMKKALQQEGSRDNLRVIVRLALSRMRTWHPTGRPPCRQPWRAEKVVTKKKTVLGPAVRTMASRQGKRQRNRRR